ncbi:hypothetical protein EZS27_038900, partial [termite gut metagenome]
MGNFLKVVFFCNLVLIVVLKSKRVQKGTFRKFFFSVNLFDFDTPDFIWRFVKGETDYLLGVTTYAHFLEEYRYYNRSVW